MIKINGKVDQSNTYKGFSSDISLLSTYFYHLVRFTTSTISTNKYM